MTRFSCPLVLPTCGPRSASRGRLQDERGAALIMAILIAMLLTALGTVLLALTTTETALSASHRYAQETRYGAEAALELAIADLATTPGWSSVLAAPPANRTSRFADAAITPRAPDGRTLDLAALTIARQRESDARDGPDRFGANSPQWRLYLHAALSDVTPPTSPVVPLYLVVWVADDGLDGDGDATVDANETLLLHAVAYGSSASRRAVESTIVRRAGMVQVATWRFAGAGWPYLLQLQELSMSNLARSSLFGTRLLTVALVAGILAPALAEAQQSPPLAEVARKEAERRKGMKESGKVITTKDLPESARRPAASSGEGTAQAQAQGTGAPAASGGDAKPAAASAAAADASKGPAQDEQYWRNRLKTAQDGLARAETFSDALQSRVNALTTDFANRDDPYQRAKVGEDRVKAVAELEKVKGEILAFRKQLDDIQEEARKAGVPPGWLR
jgi:hypothetical protein